MAINISDNNPRVNYTATSGQTVFTVPFEFFASTDLTVYVDGSVLAVSDYTVTGGSGSTGSITTDSGQSTGTKIAIVRDVPLERTTDLTSTYSASSLNDQLDRIVTQIADLDDRVSRSISLNDYEVGVSLDLPATATRLGKTIQFNSSTGALEIGPSGNELTSIASIASEITALDGIKTNITTVASAITNVNSVGSNISSVTSVASNISNVNTVNTNIANVNSVAGSISDLNDVADSLDQVELVGGSISNVDIVGPAIANVNTVAGDISNINTVAGISANITTVAGITADISTVNSNSANINLVATNIDDVNDVANVITKVTTVADNIANVNTVAPSVSYLSTVANNIANINTLAPISADITAVAGVASSVGDAAANAAAAEAAKVAAEAAQAAAELAADNFDDTYLGAKSSDPTADNDGDALTAGDLYFSTTDNNLKVYTGSAWQAAALDASGFVDVTGDSMTGNLLFGDGNEARFGTHSDLRIEHDLNNSNIIASNNKPLNITANGVFNINSDNIFFREHAASNTYMEMRDGGGYDHAVRIFHSGTNVRLETTSTGININGNATFGDNDKAIFGAGSDLQIYHSGTGSYITEAGVGDLYIQASNLILEDPDGNNYFAAIDGGATLMYHNGASKLATTSTGIDVTGTVTADSLTVQGVSTVEGKLSGFGPNAVFETTGTAKLRLDDLSSTSQNRTFITNNYSRSVSGFSADNSSFGVVNIGLQDGFISFDTAASGNNYPSEAMRIDSSGNVGIGTSSPSYALDVQDAAATRHLRVFRNASGTSAIMVQNADTGSGSNDGLQLSVLNGGDAQIANLENTNLRFLTNSSERMRIDSSGNLLVGTTSDLTDANISAGITGIALRANKQLAVSRTGNTVAQFNRNTSDGDIVAFRKDGSTVGSIGAIGGDVYFTSTGANAGLRSYDAANALSPVTNTGGLSDGNVNLGWTDSRFKDLYLSGGVLNGSTTGQLFLQGGSTSSNGSGILLNGGSHPFTANTTIFRNGSSETMRIDSSGNLLVGTTDNLPVANNDASGIALRADGNAQFSRANAATARFNRGSDGEIVSFSKDGSTVGSIGTGSGLLTIGESGQNQLAVDYDTGSAINGVRLQNSGASGGGIIIANNGAVIGPRTDDFIDLGNANQRFKDLYLSGGVYLGGTGSANKLDDYEIGDYGPTVTATGGGTIPLNTSYDRLSYTKIGRQVTITGLIVAGTVTSPSGTLRISLPFAIGSLVDTSERSCPMAICYFNGSTPNGNGYYSTGLFINHTGVSYFDIWGFPTSGTADLTIADWVSGGSDLQINLTYFTDA